MIKSFGHKNKYFLYLFVTIITLSIIIYSIKCEPAPTHKNVMFVVYSETLGGKGVYEMYQEMKKVGHDVKIAVIPMRSHGGAFYVPIDTEFAKKFAANDVMYPCGTLASSGEQCKGITSESIKGYQPDYIFIQNPYETLLNESLRKLTKKLMHVVYGPYIFYQKNIADPNLPNLIDTTFVDSEVSKNIFVQDYKFSKNKVVVSGYQSYKEMRNLKDKVGKHKQETILWLPRWVLSFKDRDRGEGGSTFLNYHYFFYNYALHNPHVHFIIRPHVGLFEQAVSKGHLSQEDFDKIFERFRALKNVEISMHNSSPLIKDIVASDIVISDGTSALGEVVVADKPIIYLSNGWNNEFTVNKLSRELEKYVYLAYEPSEILQYIDIIRKDNYKPLREVECVNGQFWCKFKETKCKILGEVCSRESYKEILDPVENPAKFIADYLLNDKL